MVLLRYSFHVKLNYFLLVNYNICKIFHVFLIGIVLVGHYNKDGSSRSRVDHFISL